MGDFGKLDFSTSFNPTSAFPIDARCYFTSLDLAKAAAATAEEAGSSNTKYYYGMKLVVDDGTDAKWYTIQRDGTLTEDVLFYTITQDDYDALVVAGTVDPRIPYFIIRE